VVREAILSSAGSEAATGSGNDSSACLWRKWSGLAAAEMEQAEYSGQADVPITANAPHSMASDAWKGLVFTLMAGNRKQRALENAEQDFPPDVRRATGAADIEFVQGGCQLVS